jgi:hypothetical protein
VPLVSSGVPVPPPPAPAAAPPPHAGADRVGANGKESAQASGGPPREAAEELAQPPSSRPSLGQGRMLADLQHAWPPLSGPTAGAGVASGASGGLLFGLQPQGGEGSDQLAALRPWPMAEDSAFTALNSVAVYQQATKRPKLVDGARGL